LCGFLASFGGDVVFTTSLFCNRIFYITTTAFKDRVYLTTLSNNYHFIASSVERESPRGTKLPSLYKLLSSKQTDDFEVVEQKIKKPFQFICCDNRQVSVTTPIE
jgi:hypothetical protein